MPFATAALNYMLDQVGTNKLTHASLHTAYSASGANEVTGGGYARKALTWGSAASGGKALSGSYVFDVPVGTVAWVGFWDASTSGNFQAMAPAGAGQPLAFTAAATGDALTVPGHTFADTSTVVVFPAAGATLPAGLTAGTVYYVRDSSTPTLKLAATSGGSAIDLTANGGGLIQAITAEVFAAPGTYTLSDPASGEMLSLV